MTCPMESLPEFYSEHWDVESLCAMSNCVECTAEPGEGILWHLACPPPDDTPSVIAGDYDDIPF
ncbi:MAG: hypothetical protein IJG13_18300 [Kiritimatiellae bacterium]|nr:hypothetical protein [Kiritimatiellia bacterium]MBQ3343714.1 hypothetical protein [Kiritimatiellia bacterium]